jgi:hypothetical protein
MKFLSGLIDYEDWDTVDGLIYAGVWLGLIYWGSFYPVCAKSSGCGPFDLWLFAAISVAVFPAAYFLSSPIRGFREILKKKKKKD